MKKKLIQFKNIVKSYEDGKVVLKGIDLDIYENEFVTLLGPSGCGKSTLLKIIASLLSPTSGRLFFDDADVATLSPERYRQQVSYCAQTPALFGDSVYDNLIFPWQIRNKQPDPQALLADLQRFGLDENMLEKSINELSGGEKQRVSLIRNLQFLPRVLLLDEPTAAMGIHESHRTMGLLKELRDRGMTQLIISHNLHQVFDLADYIYVMRSGRIMAGAATQSTSPDELRSFILHREEEAL